MSITIQFVATASLGAGVIRFYSHCPYSHVDAMLDGGWLLGVRSETIGAVQPGDRPSRHRSADDSDIQQRISDTECRHRIDRA